MPLFGVPFSDFGGIDLRSDADATGGCIDMLNIDLDVVGRMRSRDGFTKFTTSAAASPMLGLTPLPTIVANGQIIGPMVNGKVEAVNATSGALVAATTNVTTSLNAVQVATNTGTTVAYLADAGGATGLLKWSGSAYSAFSWTAGSGVYVNITPVDFRLMVTNLNLIGNTDTNSTVGWSDPGSPEVHGLANYVQLNPGDGETIRGVCNFANQTFVFKETKFYVFTGNTTDASGNPIFNFRTVNTGIGAHPIAAGGCCAAAPDGVYFFGKDGIYKTTGGAPVKVSGAVDPLFGVGGPVPPYFQGQSVSYTAGNRAFMQFYKNRIYVTYDGASSRGMLVYDIPTQQWMYWNVSANGLCANPISGALTFSYAGLASPTSTDDLGAFSSSATTDAGTNITGRYRTGIFTFDYRGRTPTRGIAGVEKIVRETVVDGMGTVSYTLGNNWTQPANLPATRSLVLGTAPQVAQARDRTAVKGRAFSMQFSGTAPWTVERATMNLHGYEPTGVKET